MQFQKQSNCILSVTLIREILPLLCYLPYYYYLLVTFILSLLHRICFVKKCKIVFKNNPDNKKPSEEKVPEVRSPNSIPWINEDEEYCKHLAKFFKGEVE